MTQATSTIEVDGSFTDELDAFFGHRWDGNPYDLYARVRAHGPAMPWRESVLVSRHEDVKAVYKDNARFLNGPVASGAPRMQRIRALMSDHQLQLFDRILEFERPTPIRSNGDDHARLRGAVQRTFTPKRVLAMKGRLQEIADELADSLDPSGPVDLIAGFAYKLPLLVILEIMGVPREDEVRIHEWAGAIGANRGGVVPANIEPAYRAFVEFKAYVDEQVARLEANPDGNLLSILLDAQHEGRLTADELSSNVINILFAGHETTTNLIGNGTYSLLTHRDQWERLVADPSLVPSAIEELLRFEAPVQFTARTAAEDTEIAGVPVPKGTHVIPMIAAANRDPSRFTKPDALDITREDNDHITFGFGAHYCLGTFLARVEGEVAFSTLVRRFPEMTLVPGGAAWRPNRNLRGLATLPVNLRG